MVRRKISALVLSCWVAITVGVALLGYGGYFDEKEPAVTQNKRFKSEVVSVDDSPLVYRVVTDKLTGRQYLVIWSNQGMAAVEIDLSDSPANWEE